MFKKLSDSIKNEIYAMENSQLHIVYSILTFIGAIALRGFWESYSDIPVGNLQDYTGPMIPHFFFWYIVLALFFIIIFYFATKEKIEKIVRVVLPFFLVLLIVPFVDIILSWGKGADITYMLPGIHHDILIRWFTLSGSTPMGMGGTIGLKVEALLATFFCFMYVFWIKRNHVVKSIIVTFIFYSTIFWWGSLPYLIYFLQTLFQVEHIYSETILTNFELLLILLFGSLTVFLYKKDYFKAIIKQVNPLKIAVFELLFLLGVSIGLNQTLDVAPITQETVFYWIFAPFLIFFAYLFHLFIRHIISEKLETHQSLFPLQVPYHFFKTSAIFLFIALVVYSFTIDFTTTFIILFFVFSLYIYYNPPLTLRRIPVLSKILLSQSLLSIILLGYYFSEGRLNQFPKEIILFFILGITLLLNFLDLKEYKFDTKHKVLTLPTLVGVKNAKIISGIFLIIIPPMIGVIVNNMILTIVLFVIGIADLIIIYKLEKSEKIIVLTNMFKILILIFFLYSMPQLIPYTI